MRGRLAVVFMTAALVAAACGSSGSDGPAGTPAGSASAGVDGSPTGDPSTDKLAQILARGTLVLATDVAYPPGSYSIKGEKRAAGSKCAANQLTANQVTGYDAETGKLVADALGVEACFVTPTWTEITSGNWGDRWDVAWQGGSINEDRMERLWMTQPYFAVPNLYYVRKDSRHDDPGDLDGLEIGACASCSQEFYLRGELEIPGVELVPTVRDPQIVLYDVEFPGLRDVENANIDAFLAAETVGQQAIGEGVAVRALDVPAFTYYPTGFVDKSSGLDAAAFVERVNEIIQQAHADGSLEALSMEFFGKDYATEAGAFDLDSIGQQLT